MSDDVRDIKARLDIADVIGDYVELRRRGGSLWALCPFHAEKTPSFSVQPERGTFHCFGCGKSGDVFTFVMEMEGMDFPEALRSLAERAGVTLTGRRGSPRVSDRTARSLLEDALAFFKDQLAGAGGSAPRAYLSRRRIESGEIAKFEIGWAPPSWDSLKRHLASIGAGEREMADAGLITVGERGSYDRFRGRIMFPIRDEMARITGFGGRVIEGSDAKAKYLNSPEGELFSKSKILYLMHEAKRAAKARGRVILTEGYMDAMRCHTSGFTEAVASLGTSLTEKQASLIKRFADLCVIVYDGDGAGQEASVRGMYLLKDAGVEVRVATLPGGKDPDEVLSSDGGREAFEAALAKAAPLPIYHLMIRRADLRTPERSQSARNELFSHFAALPRLDIAEHLPVLARSLGLLQHELQREIDAYRTGCAPRDRDERDEVAVRRGRAERQADLECAICSLMWQDETLRADMAPEDIVPYMTLDAPRSVVSALLSGESAEELEERWEQIGDTACLEALARGNALTVEGAFTSEHVPKMIDTLRTNALNRRYEELKAIVLSDGASESDVEEYVELVKKLKGGGK